VVSGGSVLGGIHTAAAGAVWQAIVHGFCGFKQEGDTVHLAPALPVSWQRVRFPLVLREKRVDVTLTASTVELCAAADNHGAITVAVQDECAPLRPGEQVRLPMQ
jgi:kojibiose phosphorylase